MQAEPMSARNRSDMGHSWSGSLYFFEELFLRDGLPDFFALDLRPDELLFFAADLREEPLFFVDVFFVDVFFAEVLPDDFFAAVEPLGGGGALSPSRRASERPIAMACFGLVTFLPVPVLSLPCLNSCISSCTLSCVFFP